MAVIVDPDNLTRFDVIFGTFSQSISVYPVGATQRNSTVAYIDGWVDTTGTLERGASWAGSVAAGDVACVMNTTNAKHYYVNAVSTTTLTLTDVDDGTAGAATANLLVGTKTFTAPGDVATDVLTVTGHGYVTGDQVVINDNGNTAPTGLTHGTVYYVIRLTVNTISLATSYALALAGTAASITATTGTGAINIEDRVVVAVFTNGASTSEQILGLDTSGDGLGVIADGVTMQTVYSYGKEEWRLDSIQNDDFNGNYDADAYFDDLIRHPYPFESITSEQFEIGGGSGHEDWTWANEYTRKKVRTAGWAEKNTAGTTLEEWTGVVTLGSLDSDAQVYYQTDTATTAPTDFTFLGTVNESVKVFDTSPAINTKTYLKLFARKKARTYAQSEISDIGVTTIQTIVNRFPLSHATDAGITNNDGDILGLAPFRAAHDVTGVDPIDGAVSSGALTFDDADATFQTDGIVNGDTLRITSGTQQGYYTISAVTSETQLTLATDFELTSTGFASTEAALTYTVHSYYRVATKSVGVVSDTTTAGASEGIIETGTSGVGTITDATTGDFLGDTNAGNDAVIAGDWLLVTGSTGGANIGLYKVLDSNTTGALDPTDTVLYVDTSDNAFPGTLDGSATYRVLTNGMYLEYKEDQVQVDLASDGAGQTMTFADAGPDTITLAGTLTWDAAVAPGTMIEVTGTASNDGRYTVAVRTSSTVVTLVATDTLIAETKNTVGGTITVDNGFERTIGGVVYAYRWRVSGNNASLGNVYQFIQHQLRQTSDIDFGNTTARGDITNLLMSYASPTGTTLDMIIDNINANDINNSTFQDHSATNRNFPFTASGSLVFNSNLQADASAKYWVYFTNDDAGDNLARDYGTKNAIIVQDADATSINGNVNGAGTHTGSAGTVDGANNVTIPFTFAYDSNVQRGSGSSGSDAPVTLVAIGLSNAQFVISTGSIARTTGITLSAVSALERNYLNA